MAERLSAVGVPVFMADVKGDLTGVSQPGAMSPKLGERIERLKLPAPAFSGFPVTLWDVFGEQGHPLRATLSDMGPLLLARMLGLNETQEGVLQLVFKLADERGLLLLDAKDLRAMLQFVGENARQLHHRVRQCLGGLDRCHPAIDCSRSPSRAATGSSASRCSISTTCCRPTPAGGA
jgi:DNA helicase HerA-like ATPase